MARIMENCIKLNCVTNANISFIHFWCCNQSKVVPFLLLVGFGVSVSGCRESSHMFLTIDVCLYV